MGCQSHSLQLSPQSPLSPEFTSILWLPKPWNLRDNSLFGGHLSSPHSRPMRRAHEWVDGPHGLCWVHVDQWAVPSVSTCMRRPAPCGAVMAVALRSLSAAPTPPVPGLSLGCLQKTPHSTGRRTDQALLPQIQAWWARLLHPPCCSGSSRASRRVSAGPGQSGLCGHLLNEWTNAQRLLASPHLIRSHSFPQHKLLGRPPCARHQEVTKAPW